MPTQPQPQAPQPSLIQLTRPEQRTLQTQSPVSTLLNGPSGRAHNVFSRLRPFVSSPCPTQGPGLASRPRLQLLPLQCQVGFQDQSVLSVQRSRTEVVSAWLSTGSGFVAIKDPVTRATEENVLAW